MHRVYKLHDVASQKFYFLIFFLIFCTLVSKINQTLRKLLSSKGIPQHIQQGINEFRLMTCVLKEWNQRFRTYKLSLKVKREHNLKEQLLSNWLKNRRIYLPKVQIFTFVFLDLLSLLFNGFFPL